MRNSTLIFSIVFLTTQALFAQNYPPDPEPGACYIRCPKEISEQKVTQIIRPAYKEYKVVPAVYKSIEEQLIVKPASKRFEYVPAVYKEVIDTILVEEAISKITVVPIRTIDTFDVLEVQPAYAQFESRPALANCKSKIPGDCDVICYVQHEAVTKEIPVQKIVADPKIQRQTQKGKFKTIKRKEVVSEATTRVIEIPAEYITIQKRVLVKDETLDSVEIGALTRQESVFVRDETDAGKESNQEWRIIDCKLLEYNALPIYYDFNSDLLDASAKRIIDANLFNLMTTKPYVRIEINSHTDARASDDFNLDLSKRRARAVVDYLVSKGIKRSRLEYNGFGETQPANHCTNGVDCTEEEHAKNRRTEFRVLPK